MDGALANSVSTFERCIADARAQLTPAAEPPPESHALADLAVRARKLARALGRPQALGFFGPSQAGKSFLVGALLAHDRHPYLNELRKVTTLEGDAWTSGIQSAAGWQHVASLLWGGPGYAPDLETIFKLLCDVLDALVHPEYVEVALADVRASQGGASIIDAACLNALGTDRTFVRVTVPADRREVTVAWGVLSGLIGEIRLQLASAPGSLFDRADLLDFPGGRALARFDPPPESPDSPRTRPCRAEGLEKRRTPRAPLDRRTFATAH